MRETDSGGGGGVDGNLKWTRRFSDILRLERMNHSSSSEEDLGNRSGSSSSTPTGESPRHNYPETSSSYSMSPLDYPASPYINSPWTFASPAYNSPFADNCNSATDTALLGSLAREEGHVYSLAADGDLLYTGSNSKNVRVWKGRKEFSGFKSNSGLVKAIVISGGRIFTGHQDGKIRVWKISPTDPTVHKRVGSLPTTKDYLKSSINPNHYVRVRRHRTALWLRHFDAVSCLSLDEENGLLYSGSWDRTFKVWRILDSRCLESVEAHDDAINSIAVGFDGLVFTGSADGTVKAWRREETGRTTKHVLVQTLLEQECAVTAVAVDREASVIYCGTSDGLVQFWEWRPGRLPRHGGSLRGHRQAVLCLASAGNLVLSGSADKTICVWRRDNGGGGGYSRVTVLSGHGGPVKCLAVEEDSKSNNGTNWIVYSGSLDRSVKVWRVPSESNIRTRIRVGPELLRSPLHVPAKKKESFLATEEAVVDGLGLGRFLTLSAVA